MALPLSRGIPPYDQTPALRQGQRQGRALSLPSLWCDGGVWLGPLGAASALCPGAGVCRLVVVGREPEPQGASLPSARCLCTPHKECGASNTQRASLSGLAAAPSPSGLCIPQNGSGSVVPGCRGDAKSPSLQRGLN